MGLSGSPKRVLLTALILSVVTIVTLWWQDAREDKVWRDRQVSAIAREHSADLARRFAPLLQGGQAEIYSALNTLHSDGVIMGAAVYGPTDNLLAAINPPRLSASSVDSSTPVDVHIDGDRILITRYIERSPSDGQHGRLRVVYPFFDPSWWQILSSGAWIAAIGFGALITLVAFALWPLQRGLEALVDRMQRLRNGDWRTRATVGGVLAPLGSALNELTDDLDQRLQRHRRDATRKNHEIDRLNRLLHENRIAVWEADPKTGQFSYISEVAETILGHPLSVWLSADFADRYLHPSDCAWFVDFITQPLAQAQQGVAVELRARDTSGEWRWLRLLGTIDNRAGRAVPVGTIEDVTTARYNEQALTLIEDADALTQLLSRSRWQAIVADAIIKPDFVSKGFAVVCIELRRQPLVIELFGPSAADEYIASAAHRVEGAFDEMPDARIGRTGPGAFSIFLPMGDAPWIEQWIKALLHDMASAHYHCDVHRIPFDANAGIAMFPENSVQCEDLIAQAIRALRIAQRRGPSEVHRYRQSDQNDLDRIVATAKAVRGALDTDRLTLNFQPIVDMRNGVIAYYDVQIATGLEGDTAQPIIDEAIERFALDVRLDQWVLGQLNVYRARHSDPSRLAPMIVRLGLSRLPDEETLSDLRDVLRGGRWPTGKLVVAFDSAIVEQEADRARQWIEQIHQLGQLCAITRVGGSDLTLGRLQELKVDLCQLDANLTQRMTWNTVNQRVGKGLWDIARHLNLAVVVTGVDDEKSFDVMQTLRCRLAQGTYLTPPSSRFHELNRVVLPRRNG